MSSGKCDGGFTYLGVLFVVAALGAGAASGLEVWSHQRQRDKEAELLWIGNQFRDAIGLYYQRTPGAAKRYPERLEDLLLDKRYPSIQRYLRRVYTDPISGQPSWGLVLAPDGGIMGVHSFSEKRPIKTVGAPHSSGSANAYSDWKFVFEPIQVGRRR